MTAAAPKSMFDTALRVALAAALVTGVVLLTRRAVAEWHFRKATTASVRRAAELEPRNAVYQAELARFVERSFEGRPEEVIPHYERAVELNPAQASYWAELGGAYETAGRSGDARRAYERARELYPNSPEINWKLGNFYLRAEEIRPALRAFRETLEGNVSMRRPLFELAWRAADDNELILAEMIPTEPQVLLSYLNFLVATGRPEAAREAWRRLQELGRHFPPQQAFRYLDALIRAGRVEEVVRAWAVLAERNPTVIYQRPFEENAIYNGSFERDLLNGGLDWRVQPVSGAVVSTDSMSFFDGTRSLRIRFDGTQNLNYWHVYHYVPVKANTLYRFTGYLRPQGITTDSGPRFQIFDAYDRSRLFLELENIVGTSSWVPQHREFVTGPETQLLMVRVARPPSRKIDSQISGTVWIDRLSLSPAE